MHRAFSTTIREDIRLLGRLLGETLKEQEGEAVFASISLHEWPGRRLKKHGVMRPAREYSYAVVLRVPRPPKGLEPKSRRSING